MSEWFERQKKSEVKIIEPEELQDSVKDYLKQSKGLIE